MICLVNIRPKQFSENYLPYFTLLFLLSLPKLKNQSRIKLFHIASRYQDFTFLCNCVTMYITHFWLTLEELLLYRQVCWVQIDENRYQSSGQAWPIQIGITLLAYMSPEKIAFLCKVFLRWCNSNYICIISPIFNTPVGTTEVC